MILYSLSKKKATRLHPNDTADHDTYQTLP
jgi:hypothetical protein